jgi:tetratricopeptide (TPR) repeat protein
MGYMGCAARKNQIVLPETDQLMDKGASKEFIETLQRSMANKLESGNLMKKHYTKDEAGKALSLIYESFFSLCLMKRQDVSFLDIAFIMNGLIKKYQLPFKHTVFNDADPGLMVYTIDYGIQYLPYGDLRNAPIVTYSKKEILESGKSDPKLADRLYLIPINEEQLMGLHHYNLGYKFMPTEPDTAITHYKKSIQFFPDWQPSYLALAGLFAKNDEIENARAYYQKAKKIGDSDKLEQFSSTFSFLE